MKNSIKDTHDLDDIYEQYKDVDFSDAKPVKDIPALSRLQAEHGAKQRVTMRLDGDLIAAFKAKAAACGGSYQTLINNALRDSLTAQSIVETIRQTIKEELHHN